MRTFHASPVAMGETWNDPVLITRRQDPISLIDPLQHAFEKLIGMG